MPSEHDERKWMAVGEQTGAARAGQTMWSGPYLRPGERVVVVPEARAVAAEQRIAELERELRQVCDVSDGYRLALVEAEALLAKAGRVLRCYMGACLEYRDRQRLAVSPNDGWAGVIAAHAEARAVLAEILHGTQGASNG